MVFGMIGGLGLFLYGMTLTGDGLRRAAGEKMKHVLEVLTSTPLKGVIVGAVMILVRPEHCIAALPAIDETRRQTLPFR